MITLNADVLTAKYLEIRDRRAALKKGYEAEDGKLKHLMDGIEDRLKTMMHELGAKSLRTEHGTPYIAYQESATVADWDALLTYIKECEAWDLLERRVSKTGVKNIMEEDRNGQYQNPPPPGVNFTRFEVVNVRRS